jgi:hypothetical protein
MIKFFRHIRQRLLTENKFSKYLLYAIGEIALVMIGILLALQVNDWNENRFRRDLEKSTLKEIKESLDFDITMLQDQVETQTHYWKQIERLIQELKSNKEPSESIENLLIYPVRENIVNLNSSAFELLENRGIDLISNQSLKKEIVKHFKYDQQDIIDRSKVWGEILLEFGRFFDALLDPIIDNELKTNYVLGAEKFKALDYSGFRSNELVVAKLKYRIHRKIREIALLEEFIKEKESLRNMISEVLKE